MGALNDSNAVSLLGVKFWDKSIEEKFSRETSYVRRTGWCKWTDRATLHFLLLGGAALLNGQIVVQPPCAHPQYPWMFVTGVGIDMEMGVTGLTQDSYGVVKTDYARMEIEYTTLDPLDMGEERVDYSARVITVPDNTFKWVSDNKLLRSAESPGIEIPQATFQRTVNSQPKIPVATILSLLGKVNKTAFLGADPETLLFCGCCTSRRWTSQGQKAWDVTYSLKWNGPQSWNAFLRADGGGVTKWDKIVDIAGNPPYPLADLSQLGFSS